MPNRVCPWWLGYLLVNPLRRFWHNPRIILRPFVIEGMLVLEPGCGMGFFTIEMARLVGQRGRVVAIDLQPKMLAGLQRRARKAGVSDRIDARLAKADGFMAGDLAGAVDFALAFAVVHEMPDEARFFAEIYRALRPGGKLLVVEPKGHVTGTKFHASVETSARLGFHAADGPVILWSRTVLLERG